MRRLGVASAAVALALFSAGLSVWVLSAPWYTQALSQRVSHADEAGLTRERAVVLAEEVRAFVADGGPGLPLTVDGRPGFDEAATAHLADVARVLSAARWTTLAMGAALALAAAGAFVRGRRAAVASALKAGAALSVGLVVLAALFALTDFSAFFSAFHGLFFAEGTWTFPSDSLLIRLFPEPFWVTSGAVWGGLVLAFAGGCWAAAAWIVRGHPTQGA